jgi:hypothetical protein
VHVLPRYPLLGQDYKDNRNNCQNWSCYRWRSSCYCTDELRTKTATFKQRLDWRWKPFRRRTWTNLSPKMMILTVAELLAMGFFRKRGPSYVLTLDHNSSYERLGETKRPPCLSLTRWLASQ